MHLRHLIGLSVIFSVSPLLAELGPEARPKVIYTPIVLTGQSAPGGGTFFSFPYHSFINDADQVVFLGDTLNSIWGEGIYLAGPTGLTLVAHANQPAPGYAPGVMIQGFDINYHRANNVGQVSFEATLSGPGMNSPGDDDSNAWGNWFWSGTELRKIAQWRTPAPGTGPGVNYRTFSRTTLNDLGQVAYSADLIGPNVNPNNDTAFFFGTPGNIQLLAREGDPAPGGLTYGDMSGFDYPVLSAKGNVAFLTSLAGGPYRNRALIAGTPNNLVVVARTGQTAPGTNATFDDVHGGWNAPRINDRGEVLFVSTLGGAGESSGIFTGKPDHLTLVARVGGLAPGLDGAKFTWFYDIDLSSRGDVTFRADVAEVTGTNYAIYAGRSNNLLLVAATGQHAPGTEDGVEFGYLTDPVINKDGQVAFFGYLTGANSRGPNDYGIFATGHSGDLRLIARYGDDFQVGPGDIRSIVALSHAGVFGTHILTFNADSDLVFLAKFADGSEGIFTATVLPEPTAAIVLLLGAPLLSMGRRRSVKR